MLEYTLNDGSEGVTNERRAGVSNTVAGEEVGHFRRRWAVLQKGGKGADQLFTELTARPAFVFLGYNRIETRHYLFINQI